MARHAVVLMNLGGPDSLRSVRPFLQNLFADRAIINLPGPLRLPLAWAIAQRRSATARRIYAQLGGASPLLRNTEAQAGALEAMLGPDYRCFIAMRYWHPLTRETVSDVAAWQPDDIILLPLYPQFSTTTTQSSLRAWEDETGRQRLTVPTRNVRSYPTAPGLVAALAARVRTALQTAAAASVGPVRLLFSAHGLPLKTVAAGDPYPEEVAATATAVLRTLGGGGVDAQICFQSRVGPLAWLGPSVEEELRRAGRDRVAVVVVPVSFVSEHSETLVELDRDYRRVAERCGVPAYYRVPTVGSDSRFIAALGALVRGEGSESRVGHEPQVPQPA